MRGEASMSERGPFATETGYLRHFPLFPPLATGQRTSQIGGLVPKAEVPRKVGCATHQEWLC